MSSHELSPLSTCDNTRSALSTGRLLELLMAARGTERLDINLRYPVTLKDKTRLTSHGRTSLLTTLLSRKVLAHLPTMREVVVNVAGPVYQQHGRRCLHVLDRTHILDFVFGGRQWHAQRDLGSQGA